jgi:predicted GIY-YIG superfamily endonuclease
MRAIKVSGVYIITHEPTGMCYIGESVDIFGRWGSHNTNLRLNRHSSVAFQALWDSTNASEWTWRILEIVSKTEQRIKSGLKGAKFTLAFKRHLRYVESKWMSMCSIEYALNQNKKSFK